MVIGVVDKAKRNDDDKGVNGKWKYMKMGI